MIAKAKGPEVVTLPEWSDRLLRGFGLTESDRRLVGLLAAEAESRLVVEELRDGLRIASRAWVGVVRFEALEIQVLPKLAGDNAWLVEMIDYATGVDSLRSVSGIRSLHGTGASLLDLLVMLLCEECDAVVKSGLVSDYVEREEELPVLRGKLLVDRQVRERFGRLDRLICRHDEHETDILENRVLAAALSVCARRTRHPALRSRTHRLEALFHELCTPEPGDLEEARKTLTYHRLNEHYRPAHELAWLVLEGLGVRDLFGAGPTECFAFLINMNALFERFVTRLVTDLFAQPGWRVSAQRRDRSIIWNAASDQPYQQVIPDLLVERSGAMPRHLAIDAKYKTYDAKKLDAGDVYQAFMYAYAYGAHDHGGLPRALIFYPSTKAGGQGVRLLVRTSSREVGAEIQALGLSIPDLLAELRASRSAAKPELERIRGAIQACLGPVETGALTVA